MLHVHRAERTDILARALADVLAQPPADPFAAEVVAVPTRGVERWITQRLSHRLGTAPGGGDGVCARTEFPSPGRLVAEVVAAAAGVRPDEDPWRAESLVWPVLEVVDQVAGEPWCPVLGAYLGLGAGSGDDPHRRGRRHAAAQRIAGLFASYGSQRPAMVRAWAAGPRRDGTDDDGTGAALAADVAWQAELWRRVRNVLGFPSPAERLPGACGRLRAEPGLVDLPERVSVFGPTRLTGDQLAVLHALAAHRDVHLWVPHPSPALWRAVAELPAADPRMPRRRDDPSAGLPRHPLLAALARDARELQVALAAAAVADGASPVTHHHHAARVGDDPVADVRDTLLARLRADLREDRVPDGRARVAPGDGSVQVHACYGPARQVEVLREVLLGLLADDPTLEPRDVLVMCPDVEAFAPLLGAAFGPVADLGDAAGTGDTGRPGTSAPDRAALRAGGDPAWVHPGHRLRVRLADRALRRTNPLVDLAALLVDLAGSRCTAPQLLDLAALPVVRRRFGWGDDEVERLRQWVGEAGVRWGLDAGHRRPFRLDGLAQNTWRAGLDRVLLGVAQRDEGGRSLATAVPLDDVGGDDADLAGRLAEFVDRVGAAVDALSAPASVAAWANTLEAAVAALAAPARGGEWQAAEAGREIRAVLGADGGRPVGAVLAPADVRSALAPLLAGRPTRSDFRTGDLTICSLVPMRSVPHRVVALLGMDDAAFGGGVDDGDDVLARHPLVGERDRRSEQRQMVLDAVLAAGERLVVLYTGADDRTNAPLPPAVPVGELLDALDATARTDDGGRVRDAILTRHPLQPFDARHFGVPAPVGHPQAGRTAAASFDAVSRAGAVALVSPREPAPPFLAGPLPAPPSSDVALADLVAVVEHPVKAFLRGRLGVSLAETGDELGEDVPAELAPLDRWQVGDRLLRAALRGDDPAAAVRVERLRGAVPPGTLGGRAIAEVATEVAAVAAVARPWMVGESRVVDVVVDLPDGTRLGGSVPRIHRDGDAGAVVRVEYSRLKAKHRLRAWVEVLALAAGVPGGQWRAVTVGRGRGASDAPPGAATSLITAPAPDAALAALADLVDLYRRAMREPLPLVAEASAAYARRRLAPATGRADAAAAVRAAVSAAGSEWIRKDDTGRAFGEGADPQHLLVWGDVAMADLCAVAAVDAERRGGVSASEAGRFGVLACRVWEPLLAHEEPVR
jgi:exodeoxyribonuclease V gamma subunit